MLSCIHCSARTVSDDGLYCEKCREEKRPKHCIHCGARLERKRARLGFDRQTGQEIEAFRLRCPRDHWWSIAPHSAYLITPSGIALQEIG